MKLASITATEADPQVELAATRTEIARLTAHLEQHPERVWRAETNLLNRLRELRAEALNLEATIEAEDERLARLIVAARRIGDPALATVAYLVYGAAGIGTETLYRLAVTHFGFTRSDSVHVNVLAADVPAVRDELAQRITEIAKLWAYDPTEYDIEIVAL